MEIEIINIDDVSEKDKSILASALLLNMLSYSRTLLLRKNKVPNRTKLNLPYTDYYTYNRRNKIKDNVSDNHYSWRLSSKQAEDRLSSTNEIIKYVGLKAIISKYMETEQLDVATNAMLPFFKGKLEIVIRDTVIEQDESEIEELENI